MIPQVELMLEAAIENCSNQQHGLHDDAYPLCKACIIKFSLDYADEVSE